MAFPLAAIGAGIGQFAQQYAQQQEQAKQTMMLQMQLEKFKQEQEQLGRERQAASGLWAAVLGGDLGLGSPAPIQGLPQVGGGSQGWLTTAAPPGSGRFTDGGGMRAGGPGMVPGGGLTKRGGVTLGEAKAAALRAGFDENGANIITAITVPESSLNPYAHNPRYPDDSYGLTQINARAHGPIAKEAWGNVDRAMELAYKVSRGGTNFSPWTTYTSGAYKPYLAEAAGIRIAAPASQTAARVGLPGGGAASAEVAPTDLAAGTGQFAMPTDAAAGLGAPRPTGPPDTLVTGGGGATTARAQPAAAVALPPLPARATLGPDGNPRLPADATSEELDAAYDYVQARQAGSPAAPAAAPAPAQPVTVPPATPTDYSRPPPAVAPPPGAAAARPTSSLTGTGAVQPGGTQVAQADPMRLLDQQATTGAQGAAKGLDPSVMGRLSTQAIMQRIDKAMPNADPLAKMMALEKAQKLLAPDQQVQFQLWKMQHQEELRAAIAKFQQEQINQRMQDKFAEQEARAKWEKENAAGTIMQTDKGPVRIRPGSNVAEPIDLGGAQPITGAAKSSRNVEVVGADGNKIFSGAAHQNAAGQWVSDKDQKVIEIPEDANISIAGTAGGGRQGEQQAARITSAANLLSFELGNMMQLPAMSTASIFQGVESTPGRHLGESLKRTFAAKLTPETATDLATSFQGISRAVAALESGGAATGLVGLTKASEVYMPQPTDTVGNVWRKFATLRGVLERSLQAAASAKDVTPERKKLYEEIKEEVARNIPWTVEEVTKLTSGNVQTYKQLFEKTQQRKEQKAEAAGAQQKGAPPVGTDVMPLPANLASYDDGYVFRNKTTGEKWVKQGNRLVKTPDAVVAPGSIGPEFSAPIPPAPQ